MKIVLDRNELYNEYLARRPMIREEPGLDFDDVLLVPSVSDVQTRRMVTLQSEVVEGIRVYIPLLSAPMDTVTTATMAIALGFEGGMGVIHRYLSIEDQAEQVRKVARGQGIVAAAIGIKDWPERVPALVDATVDILVLDVANAHNKHVMRAVQNIKQSHPNVSLMVGNIATANAAFVLADLGADAVKVGIGNGSVCDTRLKTGFGFPQLTAIMEIAERLYTTGQGRVKICSDGGVKNSGDIAKALAAGAHTVMSGRLFADCYEAPLAGLYRGMASAGAKLDFGLTPIHVEGHREELPAQITVRKRVGELADGLRSAFSYAGARNLTEFQESPEFIRVTRQK